jgi:CBS domain-containing protein
MELMTENHVTGLPVMDFKARCVGLISATDILNYEQEHSEFTAEANDDVARHFDAEKQRWESVRVSSFALEEFGDVHVKEVMTRELLSVDCDTPVKQVAKLMVESAVHRVLVLSEQRGLQGLISSIDFVRVVAES